MAHPTALPLSQQILAWLTTALGYGEDHLPDDAPASYGTMKRARRGEVLSRKWDAVVETAILAFGGHIDPETLESFVERALRDWDRQVGELDGVGLDLKERMPAVLRSLLPAVGVRLGALAAAVDGGDEEGDRRIRDVLCDPLSPRVFGNTFDALVRRSQPTWKTWNSRYQELDGIVGQRTIERWRSDELVVPSPAEIKVVAEALANGGCLDADVIEQCLRWARVATVARIDLSKPPRSVRSASAADQGWAGEAATADFASILASFAKNTSATLLAPGQAVALAKAYLDLLDSEHGEGVAADLYQFMGLPNADRIAVGEWLRARVRLADSAPNPACLQPLLLHEAFNPHPILVAAIVAQHAGLDSLPGLTWGMVPRIQMGWRSRALLHALSQEPLAAMGQSASDAVRWPTLQELAQELLDRDLRLTSPTDSTPVPQLWVDLLEQLGPEVKAQVVALFEDPKAVLRLLDPSVEKVIPPGEQLSAAMLAHRAGRLAAEGNSREALATITLWAKSPTRSDSQAEILAVVEALMHVAHTQLDIARELRAARAHADLSRALATVRGLTDMAEQFVRRGAPDEAGLTRAIHLLPVHLRLAALEGPWADKDGGAVVVAEWDSRLKELSERHPTHGGVWAMRALWQRHLGVDASKATEKATHFGHGSALQVHWERLSKDAELPEPGGIGER